MSPAPRPALHDDTPLDDSPSSVILAAVPVPRSAADHRVDAVPIAEADAVLGQEKLTVLPGPAAPGPGWRIVGYLAVPDGCEPPAATPAVPVPVLRSGLTSAARARGVRVDREMRTATVDGRTLPLTYMEFELLDFFVSSPRRVHSRAQLLRAVWDGVAASADGRTVDVHVARLRRKLGERYRRQIVTVRGFGYRYDPESEGFGR